MTCGLMSLRSAACGMRPSVIARPPQNGSTKRLFACGRQNDSTRGTCHRLPPAHLSGGGNDFERRAPRSIFRFVSIYIGRVQLGRTFSAQPYHDVNVPLTKTLVSRWAPG